MSWKKILFIETFWRIQCLKYEGTNILQGLAESIKVLLSSSIYKGMNQNLEGLEALKRVECQ